VIEGDAFATRVRNGEFDHGQTVVHALLTRPFNIGKRRAFRRLHAFMVIPSQDLTVIAHGLVKRYGDVTALDGLDLEVKSGTVLGLLGPNGAGKTTAVSILTTLVKPTEGTATVAGIDVLADPKGVRSRIGLSGQYAAVDEHLTATENLEMIGCLYGMKRSEARSRTNTLIERFRLTEAANRPLKTFSGLCSSSTSPPPGSTHVAAANCGTSFATA
jgi:ABC-type polysaccharide/polyol phosphate transport system ATPase subunit